MSGRTVGTAVGVGLVVVGATTVFVAYPRGGHRQSSPTAPTATVTRRPRRRRARPPSARQQTLAVRRLASLGLPLYCAGRKGRSVALTFDDGPGPYTRFAVRLLRRNHARATFFLVGKELQWFPRMPAREALIAAIGDHTWTHRPMTALTPAGVESELVRTRRAAEQLAHTRILLFRPPYGARSRSVDAVAKKLGLLEVLWSVDSADDVGAVPRQIFRNVTTRLRPGSIVLMHENRGQTIKALKFMLPAIRRRGLRMVTLPRLLATDPPTWAQLRRGRRGCP